MAINGEANETMEALRRLAGALAQPLLPAQLWRYIGNVSFTSSSPNGQPVFFPCPLKEREAVAAIKALEGCIAAVISDMRYREHRDATSIEVDLDKTACFLMSAYMSTVDGMDKANPQVKSKLPDTDLNRAQSILYRRLSANLYETKNPGEYYHIHGSLDASTTLRMIGLPPFNPALTDYRKCINTIESAVKKFTVVELEDMNAREGQAGVPVLTSGQFLATPHGKALANMPPFTITKFGEPTPPAPFPTRKYQTKVKQCLEGVKVLELCRVIAGPTIGRCLAAHGADVLKVTSPQLPDVPFFQVDVNTGKHTTALHLRDNAADRATFERLLAEADVLIDGYRPGALERLGYGLDYLSAVAKARDKGFVYVAEDCFGGTGETPTPEWAGRPGWQQIADCVTGVAWAQGRFMGLDEPVVPPFPMSDYGTGALGCAAALAALALRAADGGSYACRTSLCQYDTFLLSLGPYPREVQDHLRAVHDADFFALRHADSVDEVGRRALRSMRRLYPHLFTTPSSSSSTEAGGGAAATMMQSAWSRGFGAELRWPREALHVKGLHIGHVRASRPNGFDEPTWEGWEVDEDVLDG